MSCGALQNSTNPKTQAPWSGPVTLTIDGKNAVFDRKWATGKEQLQGPVTRGQPLILEGRGWFFNKEADAWKTSVTLIELGPRYEGIGTIESRDGKTKYRDCTVSVVDVVRMLEKDAAPRASVAEQSAQKTGNEAKVKRPVAPVKQTEVNAGTLTTAKQPTRDETPSQAITEKRPDAPVLQAEVNAGTLNTAKQPTKDETPSQAITPTPTAQLSLATQQYGTPTFSKDENYGSVRQKMLEGGWQPYHDVNADVCANGDARCQGRPEMQACAGSGMANCRFLWKKDGKTIVIFTVGEDAVFDGMEQEDAATKPPVVTVPTQEGVSAPKVVPTTASIPGDVSSSGSVGIGAILTAALGGVVVTILALMGYRRFQKRPSTVENKRTTINKSETTFAGYKAEIKADDANSLIEPKPPSVSREQEEHLFGDMQSVLATSKENKNLTSATTYKSDSNHITPLPIPKLKEIDNVIVWCVAFVPIIGEILERAFNTRAKGFPIYAIFFAYFLVNTILLAIDEWQIKAAGRKGPGIGLIILIPIYLWRRATMLKQAPSYFWVWWIAFLIPLLINNGQFLRWKYISTISSISSIADSAEVKQVKSGTMLLCPLHTVDQLVNGFMGAPSWTSGISTDKEVFVNVIGEIKYAGKPARAMMQFFIDGNNFSFNALEINEVPMAKLVGIGILNKMCDGVSTTTQSTQKATPIPPPEFRNASKVNVVSRSVFESSVVGKSAEEILLILGKPDQTQDIGGIKMWYYLEKTRDPITNNIDEMAQILFRGDLAFSVSFM